MAGAMRMQIERTARRLLETGVDPVVRVRLLRDVLRTDGAALQAAKREANKSRWVVQLAAEQRADGGWGRFHSKDYSLKQANGTTETAVTRALELGVERNHLILRRAATYIAAILAGKIPFPEKEKNARWPTGMRLFAASTVAQIDPRHKAVEPIWKLWHQIAQTTFARGAYDAAAELEAHRQLTGIEDDLRYLQIGNKYAMTLLASRGEELAPRLQEAILHWLFSRPKVMGYLPIDLRRPPSQRDHEMCLLRPLEIISGFPQWRPFAGNVIRWLWDQRDEDGLWNVGSQVGWCERQPLSEKRNRPIDDSVHVLCLLRRYCD